MMQKYFAVAIVAASTFVAALSGATSARAAARSHEPPAQDTPSAWVGETGTASYYGPVYHGRRSASGTRFDQEALTAAHPWLPFGTKVKVTLAATGRTVVVTITDRIYSTRRIVDLSVAAARQLGMIGRGIAQVTLLPA
ncbi:MAG TPA: septal ring lytic transglycosylase RlpA family protein [Acetobacteraceae bacterium]